MEQKITAKKVASSFLWLFSEKISAELVSFVVSIILARLLSPDDYGTIALVNVFITIANVFVISGFGNALVQKKNSDNVDFSSVFYWNIGFSLALYIGVFFLSPVLADYYNTPSLTLVFRVMGLRLFIAGINSVQNAYISKNMLFKKAFLSKMSGTIVSGVVGITMAYSGYGVWALVAQYITNALTGTIVLFCTLKWRPVFRFSVSRLRKLISYGWKLLVSELINTGYVEIRSLIIGKRYSASDLSYYTKGQMFPKLVVSNINASIQAVLFPTLSTSQDDKKMIKDIVRKSIRVSSYVLTPMILGLALVGEPLIRLLLTEKWLPCVPYLQLYCLFYAFAPIQSANAQAIKAIGRSDIYLNLEVFKKILGLALLFLAMPFGPFAIAASAVSSNIIGALINIFPNIKILNYKASEQIRDYANGFLPLALMMVTVFLIGKLNISDIWMLLLQVLIGAVVYIVFSCVFRIKSFYYVINTLLKKKG